jgi:Flp pilus assembly secretin CpaC
MDLLRKTLIQGIASLSFFAMLPAVASGHEPVSLKVGHAQTLRLDQPPTTVAVGDADIASASVASENTLVLIGKKPGSTNVIALGADGSEIHNTLVQVTRADGRSTITMVRAGQQQAYVCGSKPGCLAVDSASQAIDHAETSDPARIENGTDEPPRSLHLSGLQNAN